MDIDLKEKNLNYLLKAIWGYGSGAWCWWNHAFPNAFQIEFNNALIWMPPQKQGEKPDYKLAISFFYPTSVSFLTCKGKEYIPYNWPTLLHEEKIDDFYISDRLITFNDKKTIKEILKKSKRIDTVFGVSPKSKEFLEAQYQFAFLSDDEEIGLIVGAKDICLVSNEGTIKLEDVSELYAKWWNYFYDYKEKVGTDDAYPEDWICDTIHIMKNPNKV